MSSSGKGDPDEEGLRPGEGEEARLPRQDLRRPRQASGRVARYVSPRTGANATRLATPRDAEEPDGFSPTSDGCELAADGDPSPGVSRRKLEQAVKQRPPVATGEAVLLEGF